MQSNGFQEETIVAGVLSYALTHHCCPCWNNLQRRGWPQTGHAGHTGYSRLSWFKIFRHMFISMLCLNLNIQMTLINSCLDTDGDGLNLAREISWSKSCPLWLHLHWTQYRWDQKLNFPHKLLAAFFGESSQKASVIQLSYTHAKIPNSTITPSDSI